ncbi:MAG: hypothetical protein Q9172_002137 [Xanthocarpia lactea]
MGLVDYSESEGSEAEDKQENIKAQKPIPNTTKPAFQKVVDRANPQKIRVNLPEPVKESAVNGGDEEGPPAKKVRLGGGAPSGFNSFLPAPKRATAANGGLNGTGSKRAGLGSGVNLKTGAAPGFSREPIPEFSQNTEEDADAMHEEVSLTGRKNPKEDASTWTHGLSDTPNPQPRVEPPEQPKKQGSAMMFKPLSVARKPQKKKNSVLSDSDTTLTRQQAPLPPKSAPKVSLFSMDPLPNEHINGTTSSGTYQPMIYGALESEDSAAKIPPRPEDPYADDSVAAEEPNSQPEISQGPQSLDTIASDLNLSASAKRQLLGRQNRNASAINVVNFNTDQEYAANEVLRQAGEQVQHNPVRAIAPGKHSLKQLVNAASNQKDALEEHFASGRRNRKEAGSKYGW